MKTEGQVRIPSGCAIAAMISRDGNKMSGETITNAMKPMTDPMVLAADLPVMESIRNIKTFMPFICFLTAELPEKDARRF